MHYILVNINCVHLTLQMVKKRHILQSICLQNLLLVLTVPEKNHHLHLSLSEDCRLALWEVDRGGRYSHRCARLDGYGLGGSLCLAMSLYLWIRSDHHGFLLVISESHGSPASGRWMILLPMFSIPAAVRLSTT